MSFREEVKQRIKEGKEIKVKNPLCSKRLVVKNLKQIRQLLDEDFDEFVVIHYAGLTVDDFRPLSNGARGKVQLRKHAAANKATVVFGSVDDLKNEQIESITKKINAETNTGTKKYKKLVDRLTYWKSANSKFRFNTEVINAS